MADRLAIVANLCGYERRLDTLKLNDLGCGFSICVLVLAMLNGDTSILTGVGAYYEGKRGRLASLCTDARDRIPGHKTSWMLPPGLCLDNVPMKEGDSHVALLRLTETDLLTDGSLVLEGCIWVVDSAIDLALVKSYLLESRTPLEMDDAMIAARSNDLKGLYGRLWAKFLVDFSISLLSNMSISGFSKIVSLLWRELRPHREYLRLSSLSPQAERDYAKASFEQVVDIASCSIKWQAPSWPLPAFEAESTEPFALNKSPTILYLMQKMMESQTVAIARPKGNASSTVEYAAVFEDAVHGDQFFTPRVDVEETALPLVPASLSVPLTGYSWHPLGWRVTYDDFEDTAGRLLLRSHGLTVELGWPMSRSDARWSSYEWLL